MSHIREITEADNAAVAALVRDNIEAVGLDIPGTAYFDEALDHLSDCYGKEDAKYFVLEDDDGEVIGGIGFAGFEAMKDTAQLHFLDCAALLRENKLEEKTENKKNLILLKGFLHKCDYSASAGTDCEIRNDFLDRTMQIWKEKLQIKYNALQKFCLENREKNIIVTAPTGMGKTEAGLLWCGDNKCFFVLPLRTAINAMYERFKNN